jgi:hypothetical protein
MAPSNDPDPENNLPIRVMSRRLVKASDPSIEPHVATFSNLDLFNSEQAPPLCASTHY